MACVLLPVAALGQELRLMQAYEAALAFDPGYQASQHALDAAREGPVIARGRLLPQVNLSAATSASEGWRQFPNALNQDVRVSLDYTSPQFSLGMRWSVINLEGVAAMVQAEAQADLAEQQHRAGRLDLLDRLVMAYLQLIAAQETLRLTGDQVAASEVQLEQARRRQAAGEGTSVQTAQAAASVEAARSRLVDASSQLQIARQGVVRLTGLTGFDEPELPDAAAPTPLFPADLAEWVVIGLRSSPMVRVRERAVEVARAQVLRDLAGHAPRLDLVGSVSRVRSEGLSTIGQTSSLRSLGVQLQVPLYSGGAVQASVRQAKARERQAEEELRRERETLTLELTRWWQQVESATARAQSLAQALEASALALRGAERGRQEGMVSAGDEAQLRANDLELRRQFAQARLDLILARMRLQVYAGVAPEVVVDDVEHMWPAAPGL